MNSKEFKELKKSLEAKVNEAVRDFNATSHFDHKDTLNHALRITMYINGINDALKTIATNNDLKYKSVRWPTYDPKIGAIYSEVRI